MDKFNVTKEDVDFIYAWINWDYIRDTNEDRLERIIDSLYRMVNTPEAIEQADHLKNLKS